MMVFASRDAGPAAYLAEIAAVMDPAPLCIASPVSAGAFSRLGVPCETVLSPGFERRVGERVGSGAWGLFAGTSLAPSAEKDLLRRAARERRPAVSVIEHWSYYRERFTDGDDLILPDVILVNDELARAAALRAGLPKERLRVLGNPVLERVCEEPEPAVSRADWISSLGLPKDRRIIVFVSELTEDIDMGFRAAQVARDMLSALGPLDHLLIKKHPAEDPAKYRDLAGPRATIADGMDVSAMTRHADKVVGMGSMLLLEAAAKRGDVVSYRPNGKHPFIGNDVGATIPARDVSQLRLVLAAPPRPPAGWAKGFAGSRRRIVDFLNKALS